MDDGLWSEFSHRLRGFIRRRVQNEADAEDILQEVFLRIHRRAGDVHDADRLTAWLFQVTRNAIADYYRAPVRREVAVGAAGEPALDWPEEATPTIADDRDGRQVREELAICLRPLLGGLPAHYREALALVDLGGTTQAEAAHRLGLSVSGMKSRVQRGRQALRHQLEACCRVEVDAGGRLTDFLPRDPACGCFAERGMAVPEAKPIAAGCGGCSA